MARKKTRGVLTASFILGLGTLAACSDKSTEPEPVVPSAYNTVTAVHPKTYSYAYSRYEERAKQGDPVAQNNLGQMYSDGRGVVQDNKTAVKWFSKAAKQGYLPAQVNLGVAYLYGRGIEQDSKQACRLFLRASKEGSREARHFYNGQCQSANIG